jgi:hypothetical protein
MCCDPLSHFLSSFDPKFKRQSAFSVNCTKVPSEEEGRSVRNIDTFGSMTIQYALICSLYQEFTFFGQDLSLVTGFDGRKKLIWYTVKNIIISLIFSLTNSVWIRPNYLAKFQLIWWRSRRVMGKSVARIENCPKRQFSDSCLQYCQLL